MTRKRIRLVVIVVLIIAGASVGLWQSFGFASSESPTDIYTSGFIEAKDVAIASEIGGRIVDIAADEGDMVAAGMPLVKLDDSLLKAQEQQAKSGVELAQAYLEQAIVSRDGAKKIWEDVLDVQNNPLELEARIIAAQGEVDMAKFESRYYHQTWGDLKARLRLEITQNILENLLAIRDNPQEINTMVDEAYVTYQTAVAEVILAEKEVEQAEASLEVIRVQLDKLTCTSPISGVVAAQFFEVGEISQPGIPILTITELEEVTLTAYVPESKIGLVTLGQKVLISVDSYPEESFSGSVVYISPQALFTPKNIQLKEEREKMVFAIKIKLANPEQKLKPGMPGDARILTDSVG